MNIVDWASTLTFRKVDYDVMSILEIDGFESEIFSIISTSLIGLVILKEDNPHKIEGYQLGVTLYTQYNNWIVRTMCAELGWETSFRKGALVVSVPPAAGRMARSIGDLVSDYVVSHRGTIQETSFLCYRFEVCP